MKVPKNHIAFLFSLFGMNYAKWCAPDILHMFLVGIFKHMQISFVDSLSTAQKAALDTNIRVVSVSYTDGVSTYDSFSSLLEKINMLTGRGRESLMRMMVVCIKKNVIDDDMHRSSVIECFESMARIFTTVRGHPDAADMAWLKVKLPYVMNLVKITFTKQKRAWGFPKFHAMLHLPEHLFFWGSLSNVSMSPYESFHKDGKVDSVHSNESATVPLTVALCRASTRRELLASLPQLCHSVPLFPSLVQRKELDQRPLNPLHPLSLTRINVLKSAWSSSTSLPPLHVDAVFTPYEKIMSARTVNGGRVVVMDASIKVGEATRLTAECSKSTPLFYVDQVFTVDKLEGTFFLTRQLAASIPPLQELLAEAYHESFDTHVRYVQPDSYSIINANSVWAKVFTPIALSSNGYIVREAFAFTASLERAGTRF
jgi:hypothetical protein